MFVMQKILKNTGIVIGVFIGLILIYLLAVYSLPKIIIQKEHATPPEIPIFILTNGVHTDIVVPSKTSQIDWTKEIKYQHILAKDTTYPYLAFGWGDKGFYLETPTWADLKLSVAFKAVFGLSSTAMHTTYYKQMRENDSCYKMYISPSQYDRLIQYISNTFKRDSAGNIIYIKTNANYGNTDAFYEAQGRYNLFYTCNTWANQALKICGQKHCLWTPLKKGIFEAYKSE